MNSGKISQRAALWDGPYEATSHEPLISLMAHAWLDFIFFAQHVVLVDILRVQ